MIDKFARAFPLWITLGAVIALIHPPLVTWFIEGGFVTPGLQVIMLSMGLTLTADDFVRVRQQKGLVLLGVFLQFTVMPALGFIVAKLFGLPAPLAAGLILVCCCPGGTASNVIAFLARADVALSVAMTTVSTLLAALATPTLSALLIGKAVPLDVSSLYVTTVEVVLLPVLLGALARKWLGEKIRPMLSILPALAVVSIVLIVSGSLGVQKALVLSSGARVLLAVVVVHGLAFLGAYVIARVLGVQEVAARTISIEVGMQNSGLGVVLARASFPDPLVAVTPALSAVVHCLYGSAVAAFWGRNAPPETEAR